MSEQHFQLRREEPLTRTRDQAGSTVAGTEMVEAGAAGAKSAAFLHG